MSATSPTTEERKRIVVRGLVQGVGFRPFVYRLASRYGLAGWVRNRASDVEIEIEGPPVVVGRFLRALRGEAPRLARVEGITVSEAAPSGRIGFEVLPSATDAARSRGAAAPDTAACEACLRELLDPTDRRYRYPFINCTDCGPRFTITRGVPYDRERTTMAGFRMCAGCRREYRDPADRRFHAQPNACPRCGPRVRLVDGAGRDLPADGQDPIVDAARLLREGAILAVKGLGGYHLACSPFSSAAVRNLRERKARPDRPFALMARDLEQARELCRISASESALLASPARPIVLLERRTGARVAEEVAPRQRTLGVMLAYTPLHHLLLHDCGIPLVMTSGNRSDEPITYRDDEASERLRGIADYFLIHDRPIHMRCDDSVVRVEGRGEGREARVVQTRGERRDDAPVVTVLRRARGYAPGPLRTAEPFRHTVLACGGELKNTFCLGRGSSAFLSHHIGDLENYETLVSFREAVDHFCRLFDLRPDLVACDLHPDYLSTKFARELEEAGLPAFGIQHHHAHVASCLADNERPAGERVIGVALDGTGCGTDGAIWGGEFLVGSLEDGFVRRAHLEYLPLPGGEAAIRQPWRMALAQLVQLYGQDELLKLPLPVVSRAGARNARLLARMLEHGLNVPRTSSAGRLFDTVAALLDLPGTERATYEGQAAVELELAASGAAVESVYPFAMRAENGLSVLQTREILAAVVEDVLAGRAAGEIAARFHRTVAEAVTACCEQLRETEAVSAVALSGGVFQNRLLLRDLSDRLSGRGFTVYRHRRVPPNDGGLCLGQAILADRAFRKG